MIKCLDSLSHISQSNSCESRVDGLAKVILLIPDRG